MARRCSRQRAPHPTLSHLFWGNPLTCEDLRLRVDAGTRLRPRALHEAVDRIAECAAAAQAAELDLLTAALAADVHVVETDDLVEKGALGAGVGDVLKGDEGVVPGQEAFHVDHSVIVDPVDAAP